MTDTRITECLKRWTRLDLQELTARRSTRPPEPIEVYNSVTGSKIEPNLPGILLSGPATFEDEMPQPNEGNSKLRHTFRGDTQQTAFIGGFFAEDREKLYCLNARQSEFRGKRAFIGGMPGPNENVSSTPSISRTAKERMPAGLWVQGGCIHESPEGCSDDRMPPPEGGRKLSF